MNIKRYDFVVDAMLGNLAKKLRILGYDTKYFSSIEDARLIEIAGNENRILLTKDEKLSRSAEKQGIMTIFIKENNEIEQITQIRAKLGISNFLMDTKSSRCVSCNGRLQPIEKVKVINQVPTGVFERQKEFWICDSCNKIYWEGSHFVKLREFVTKLNNNTK